MKTTRRTWIISPTNVSHSGLLSADNFVGKKNKKLLETRSTLAEWTINVWMADVEIQFVHSINHPDIEHPTSRRSRIFEHWEQGKHLAQIRCDAKDTKKAQLFYIISIIFGQFS